MIQLHERSVIETSQSKATAPEANSHFLKRKRRAASGGIQTRDILCTRQKLYQLSYRGSSAGQAESLNVMQRQRRLSPDKQGNSYLSTVEWAGVHVHLLEKALCHLTMNIKKTHANDVIEKVVSSAHEGSIRHKQLDVSIQLVAN